MKKLLALLLLLAPPALADVTIKGPITFSPNFYAQGARVSLDNLNITKAGPTGSLGPSGCGTVLDGYTFNCVHITGDSVIPASAAKSNSTFYYTVNGGTGSGNPVALNSVTEIVAVPSTIDIVTFFVGSVGGAFGDVPSGGSIGSNWFSDPKGKGNVVGNGLYAQLAANATGWRAMEGLEITPTLKAGSSVEARVGLDLNSGNGNVVQGSLVDAGLVIDAAGALEIGWKEAIQIGYFNGGTPITAGGRILTSYTGTAVALDTGIDISGTWQGGAGYTYTGAFFKGDDNNRWFGTGQLLAYASTGGHDFINTQVGDGIAEFESTVGNADIVVNSRTAGVNSSITFAKAGVPKWQIGKASDDSFFAFDVATTKIWASVTSGTVVLGETGGSRLTLIAAGGATLTGLPASAGAGGKFVCADTAGVLYLGATCP